MKYLSFLAFLIVLNISCASAATDERAPVQKMKARKLKRSFAIKAPVSEMYDFWSTKLSLISTLSPDQDVDLVEGKWGKEGSVILWKYIYQGQPGSLKDRMEVIDDENYRIVYKVIEGGPLDYYKSLSFIYQTSPNEKVVRWTLEYQTDNEDVGEPNGYMDLVAYNMERVDAYLTRA